ncbi:MAG: transporter, ATP-binding protein [Rickettsiaceae bacterium]|jgi:ABC-type multidrug transport system ATPase subunit|nr:transporter, ATP-binding protein [Rickettsiaceae bacterium]
MFNKNDSKQYTFKSNVASWASYVSTLGVSAIGGSIIGGTAGAVTGIAASIVDERFINIGKAHKHYLTSTTFWASMAMEPVEAICSYLFPGYQTPIYATALLTGAAISYLGNDFLDFKEPFDTTFSSVNTINRIFDQKQILSTKEFSEIFKAFKNHPKQGIERFRQDFKELSNNEFIKNMALDYGFKYATSYLDSLFLYYLGVYYWSGLVPTIFNENKDKLEFSYLLWEGAKIFTVIFVKDIIKGYLEKQKEILQENQGNLFSSTGFKVLVEEFNSKKLLLSQGEAKDSNDVLFNRMGDDLRDISLNGISKLKDLSSKLLVAGVSLKALIEINPEAIIPFVVCSIIIQKVRKYTYDSNRQSDDEYWKLELTKGRVESEVTYNINQVNVREAHNFLNEKRAITIKKQKDLKGNKPLLKKFLSDYFDISNINGIADLSFFAYKLTNNELTLAQIPILKSQIGLLYDFFNHKNFESEWLQKTIERVNKLLTVIESPLQTNINRTNNNDNKVIIDNYTLTLDKSPILKISHFEFHMGKHYALTGNSGGGKTSFLIDLKLGLSKPLESNGAFSYPLIDGRPAKVVFIDQHSYFPPDSTLLEAIYFPKILKNLEEVEKNDFIKRVIDLFKELNIDQFINEPNNEKGMISNLENKDFDLYSLSGGQRKKVGIVQAIFEQAEILILDEIFTGLDKKSLIITQQVIKKYLPKALILVVDHCAQNNNYEGFYDYEVMLNNENSSIKPMASVPLPKNMKKTENVPEILDDSIIQKALAKLDNSLALQIEHLIEEHYSSKVELEPMIVPVGVLEI